MRYVCWCGTNQLEPWNDTYVRCPDCQTLIDISPSRELTAVSDDGTSLYDSGYWFDKMLAAYRGMGCTDVDAVILYHYRERAAYWLQHLLPHLLPPARILEIGCGIGTFSHWLMQLGFEVTATELSPAWRAYISAKLGLDVSDYAPNTRPERAGRFDAVVMMDVLEHIPDPHSLFQALANELKKSGAFMAQLPAYMEKTSYRTLKFFNDPFLRYLLPGEHVLLYSWRGITRLLNQYGFSHIRRYDSIFENDMFFVASRLPLIEHEPAEIDERFMLPGTIAPYAALKNYQKLKEYEALSVRSYLKNMKIIIKNGLRIFQ